MTFSNNRRLAALGLFLSLGCVTAHAQVLISAGAPVLQNFDSLASTGATNTVLPTGWFLSEPGSNGQYVASDGTPPTPSGSVYSFGATGNSERALGSIASGTTAPTIGAQLQNDTGAPLTALRIAFTMEQWRIGALGGADRLTFAYSTNATSLTTGTWTPVAALDAIAAVTTGTADSGLDGNAAANRSAVSFDIEGLNIADDATLWIRWSDFNDASTDDGIAIDDVSIGVTEDTPPTVQSSVPAPGQTDVAVGSEIQISFSEAVTLDEAGIELVCATIAQPTVLDGDGSSYALLPESDLPFGASCQLTIDANAAVDLDGATLDPMEADFVLAFSTIADDAPVLVSSTPSNGSTTFPANASLQLTFSEPVNVTADWFQITCSISGTQIESETVVSGGPVSFTINPDTDFIPGESCQLQFNPFGITDQDGEPTLYPGPLNLSFTPAAAVVNQPPVVLSTTPMQGTDDFPPFADLVVLFSEPVTLAPGAFALSCTASTGIVLTHASSGTSFTIDTGTALVASDTCTFTIDRTLVTDAEGANPAANTTINFSVASSSVGGYYSQVNPSSPDQLRCSLHETIKGHTLFPYGWEQLEMADEDPDNADEILDIYRNCSFNRVDSRVGNPGAATTCGSVSGLRYNREHVWPRSLGFNNGNNNLAAHNDLHMLHLSDETFNAHRGNKPFATCTQASGCTEDRTITNNGDTGGNGTYPGNSNWYTAGTDGNNGSYEVWHRWRGNMARAIFYMAMRYEGIAAETAHDGDIPNLELTDNRSLIVQTANTAPNAYMGLLTTLLDWHAQDPVDARELERNEIVFGYQGNRNPFVDHPEWATLALFQSTQPATCTLGGGSNSAPVAVDDGTYPATEDLLLSVSLLDGVLDNDTDADSDALTATLVAQAANGVVSLSTNGSFTYTPTANTCGNDQFTYRASDGQVQSNVAIARIAVACVNDAPAVGNATFALAENSAAATVVGQVVASDPDAGTTLSYSISNGNAGGAFAVSSSGVITVANTAPLDFETTPQFVLTISVSDNATPVSASSTGTITINLGNVNEAPVAAGTLDDRAAQEGVAIAAFSVAGGFSDVDAGDDLDFAQGGLPAGLLLDAETGTVTGTPAAGSATGSPYTVTITATDGGGLSVQRTFSYSVTPDGTADPQIFADGFED
jgi:VCBS repeat-containing protein